MHQKLKLNNINNRQKNINPKINSEKTLLNNRYSIRSKEEFFKQIRKSTIHDISNIIWSEQPEQNGQKMTMALNVLQIPFNKFRINPLETLKEIEYIFTKNIRTINEMIYLQHLLTLYDVVPSIYLHYDLIEPNEVLFNMAICLNRHRFNKNEMIFRYGEYNDKLFFVLVGNVYLFEPLERKCEMDINQYIKYLNQLEKIEEYELIRKIIDINKVYRNNKTVLKIRMNNEKHIRKRYLQKMKASKEISKSQDNSLIEVNLNMDLNLSINVLSDYINYVENISSDIYIKRVEPNFEKNKNKKEEEEGQEESQDQDKNEKKVQSSINNEEKKENNTLHIVKYYIYSLIKKVEPFSIFGETILDDEEYRKNINSNNNNTNNFKKREFTAFCMEPSIILYLDINNWQKYFKFRQESIRTKNISTILDIPFLRNINIEYFKSKVFEHFSLFNYKIGDYIFKQNERRKKIYFIRSGEVQLIMKASINGINKIIDKKFDKTDIIHRNRTSKLQKIEFSDSEYLMNKLNNDKQLKDWKILGIYPKDIIGLDEIIDENNKYYLSAKCSSYTCEIYEIEYQKFKNMVTEDKNVKNLYIQYTKNKMEFLSKRLKHMRTLYINEKFLSYKNYLNKHSFNENKKTMKISKSSQYLNKRKYLKMGSINKILEPSLSSNNLRALSDNFTNVVSPNSEVIHNTPKKEKIILEPNLNNVSNEKIRKRKYNKEFEEHIKN